MKMLIVNQGVTTHDIQCTKSLDIRSISLISIPACGFGRNTPLFSGFPFYFPDREVLALGKNTSSGF